MHQQNSGQIQGPAGTAVAGEQAGYLMHLMSMYTVPEEEAILTFFFSKLVGFRRCRPRYSGVAVLDLVIRDVAQGLETAMRVGRESGRFAGPERRRPQVVTPDGAAVKTLVTDRWAIGFISTSR